MKSVEFVLYDEIIYSIHIRRALLLSLPRDFQVLTADFLRSLSAPRSLHFIHPSHENIYTKILLPYEGVCLRNNQLAFLSGYTSTQMLTLRHYQSLLNNTLRSLSLTHHELEGCPSRYDIQLAIINHTFLIVLERMKIAMPWLRNVSEVIDDFKTSQRSGTGKRFLFDEALQRLTLTTYPSPQAIRPVTSRIKHAPMPSSRSTSILPEVTSKAPTPHAFATFVPTSSFKHFVWTMSKKRGVVSKANLFRELSGKERVRPEPIPDSSLSTDRAAPDA